MRGNFVLVRADELRLLLPQEQVGAAGHLEDQSDGQRSLVALSSQMTLLRERPPERFVVTTLGDGSDPLGWCWNELQVLIGVELQPQPLPAVLAAPGAPVDCYVEHAGELAFLCDASRLREFALASRS